jgi:hypothetical protein
LSDSEITIETIEAAERLVGVRYTLAERQLMLGNLDGQIEAARARRALALANSVPMASRFDPRLPGSPTPQPQRPIRPSAIDPGPLPDNDEDIAFAPLTRLSQWIAQKKLSSRRLTEIYLARIEEYGPRLECFVTVTAELARAQADAADALLQAGTHLGPLHGIPYGLKDLFDTKGIRTSWGAEPYMDQAPEGDARVAALLRAAGAVLLGKTTLGALAYGDIWFGGERCGSFDGGCLVDLVVWLDRRLVGRRYRPWLRRSIQRAITRCCRYRRAMCSVFSGGQDAHLRPGTVRFERRTRARWNERR